MLSNLKGFQVSNLLGIVKMMKIDSLVRYFAPPTFLKAPSVTASAEPSSSRPCLVLSGTSPGTYRQGGILRRPQDFPFLGEAQKAKLTGA